MRKIFFLFLLSFPFLSFSQNNNGGIKGNSGDEVVPTKVFYSQKIINSNTVEVIPKGFMEFRVSHNFGDMGGTKGGISNFFGLDYATDVRIGFQTGLTNRLNLITARSAGGSITKLWELGLKYQILQQKDNDPKSPLSVTIFANTVASSMRSAYDPSLPIDTLENSFRNFSDRLSEVVQVMIARKFGTISFQIAPTYVHRGMVMQNRQHQDLDDKGLFAIGGGARIPLTKKFILLLDYFHTFRSQASIDSLKAPVLNRSNLHFYDPIGVGFEILTAGHVFHLNFTNASEILENRFIPHTVSSWGRGEFRWSFILSRNFRIFRDKKNK